MPRLFSSSVLAATAALLCAPPAMAQLRSGLPAPLPGTPMTPPPVDHPALGAQPLFGDGGSSRPAGGGGGPGGPAAAPEQPPETQGAQRRGKDLKSAVAKVRALPWHDSLDEAKARSAATGRPILLLQALGELEGFA